MAPTTIRCPASVPVCVRPCRWPSSVIWPLRRRPRPIAWSRSGRAWSRRMPRVLRRPSETAVVVGGTLSPHIRNEKHTKFKLLLLIIPSTKEYQLPHSATHKVARCFFCFFFSLLSNTILIDRMWLNMCMQRTIFKRFDVLKTKNISISWIFCVRSQNQNEKTKIPRTIVHNPSCWLDLSVYIIYWKENKRKYIVINLHT